MESALKLEDGNITSDRRLENAAVYVTTGWQNCQELPKTVRYFSELLGPNVIERRPTCPPYSPFQTLPRSNSNQSTLSKSQQTQDRTGTCSRNNTQHGGHVNAFCYSDKQAMIVLNEPNILQSFVATRSNWIFLKEVTTSCYKTIGGRVWYFRDSCNQSDIVKWALKPEHEYVSGQCNT